MLDHIACITQDRITQSVTVGAISVEADQAIAVDIITTTAQAITMDAIGAGDVRSIWSNSADHESVSTASF